MFNNIDNILTITYNFVTKLTYIAIDIVTRILSGILIIFIKIGICNSFFNTISMGG